MPPLSFFIALLNKSFIFICFESLFQERNHCTTAIRPGLSGSANAANKNSNSFVSYWSFWSLALQPTPAFEQGKITHDVLEVLGMFEYRMFFIRLCLVLCVWIFSFRLFWSCPAAVIIARSASNKLKLRKRAPFSLPHVLLGQKVIFHAKSSRVW